MRSESAARLVRLYPGGWRMRYGDEFTQVLAAQPLTLRLAVDVIGGAIDARLQRPVTASADASGGKMTAGLMKRCAAGGPQLTNDDMWRANGVMIGASLVFAALYIWAKMNLANKDMVDAFGIMGFPAALLLSMPFSYLKGASRATQVLIIGGSMALLALSSYVATLI